ncbi:hypothetical protein BDZ85DRAFT_262789 [Elsinoe ampelina]|uniref:Uncharacterized protein n=1 Tax=Elsinoe ampelina TaxID=302913 RepID=A0A6A6GBA6_9PEZI|nr:hypothetical protein BDZ85DRAFT_262789 [Elsinoe ampelina]
MAWLGFICASTGIGRTLRSYTLSMNVHRLSADLRDCTECMGIMSCGSGGSALPRLTKDSHRLSEHAPPDR